MNKKIALIIILAVILAFGIVWMFHKPKHEPLPLEEPKQEEIKEELPTVEPEKTEVKEEKEVSAKVEKVKPVKKVVKKTEAPKPKQQVEPKQEAVQLESTVVTEEVQEEKDVVVPVKYSSKNIYKYVYTPARFKK